MRLRSVAVFVKAVWELVGGGKQLGLAYDQASISFPSGCPQPSHTQLTSTARVPISPSHLHRDPLWRLSRYFRDARHDQRAHCRSSSAEPRATHTRRRGVRGYASRIRSCGAARLRGRHASTSHCRRRPRRSGTLVPTASAQRLKSRSNESGARSRRRRRGVGARTRGRARTRRCTSSRLSRRAAGL